MSKFTVELNQFDMIIKKLEGVGTDLNNAQEDIIRNVEADLVVTDIQPLLEALVQRISEERELADTLAETLGNIKIKYRDTESQISGIAISSASEESGGSDGTGESGKSDSLWWNILKAGMGGSTLTALLQMFVSYFVDGDDQLENILKLMPNTAALFSWLIGVAENNSTLQEAIKEGLGLSRYFQNPVAGSKFWDYFKAAWKQELKSYVDNSSVSKTVGSVAKWLGAAVEVAVEGVENYQEYKDANGKMSKARAVSETVIESAVDIGGTIVMTSAAAGGLAFAGIVSAPALVVAAAGGALYYVTNKGVEYITGKDIGEHASDFLCDLAESVGDAITVKGQTKPKWMASFGY